MHFYIYAAVCSQQSKNQFWDTKFLILDMYHSRRYLHELRCENLWLFFEVKKCPRVKFWETLIYGQTVFKSAMW